MMHTNIGTEMFICQFLIHMSAYYRFISGTLWVTMHGGGGYHPENDTL